NVEGGASATIRLRLSDLAPGQLKNPFGAFDDVMAKRLQEANDFYRTLTPPSAGADAANVMRQALAGMLWSKQCYFFDLGKWLDEHGIDPTHPGARQVRNVAWQHMVTHDIISIPDKWEYPWFAAWDLGFHAMALSTVDIDFAKQQLDLMLQG